ncbi:unnamed protein product [Phytophthora lilii]|uniref:Unnamed protein product n=1 Tax=Phytophthora lilii TaxID=2077276 RepID=A0A9W7CSA1_9STRA|nr:unnamed protein product [Phytophthora lilii]
MKSIMDLLIWYNTLYVKPFVKAIQAQRKLFKRFDLDLFADGVPLPGLSENVMYQTCFSNLIKPSRKSAASFSFPMHRYQGYIEQDKKANRQFSMSIKHLNDLPQKQKYLCGLCYCQLSAETVSADRSNNKLGHQDGNVLISSIKCNCARKDMNLKALRFQKLFEFNSDRLVYSIDKEQKEIYSMMKANIAGGPSIIFNRYAKRNETKIRNGKVCKKVIGFDANALASAHKAFAPFINEVYDARRAGDVDESKAMIAEMMKLVGNSAFGRSGMDMTKHKEIKFESNDETIEKKIEHFTFHGLEELNGACELTMKKRRIKNKNPIHLSIAIYQLAKLRMLQFYYDCIDFYFDRSDFEYQEMDTDSAYMAFSSAFDRRTPGLFKEEWRGDAMVSLSSKNYICYLPDAKQKVKVSAKGVQQGVGRNKDVLNPAGFETVVRDRITLQGTNKGFD